MERTKTKTIVVLGKTGTGKSSLGNTIFQSKVKFNENHSANSGTKDCESKYKTVNGRSLHLIDTPGFFDTNRNPTELNIAIVKCMTKCAPGPHAFVFVLKVEKYTLLEETVICNICKVFSDEVYKYTTVVFTHGDQLPDKMQIEEWVSENKALSELVKKCGGRCHVIDNKYWENNQKDEYRNNQFQVEELLKSIDKTVKENDGGHYTNDMLQSVNHYVQQEMEHIKESSPGNTSLNDIQEKAQENVFQKLWSKMKSVFTGVLLGALFGIREMVDFILFKMCAISAEGAKNAAGAAGGAWKGSVRGELERGAQVDTQEDCNSVTKWMKFHLEFTKLHQD